MSPSTRDRLVLGSAVSLFLAGFGAWWLLPPSGALTPPTSSLAAVWLSAGGLASAAWGIGRRAGTPESRLIASLALAATAPLSVVPITASHDLMLVRVGLTLATLATLPLCLALSQRVIRPEIARWVRVTTVVSGVAALVIGWAGVGSTLVGGPVAVGATASQRLPEELSLNPTDLVLRWLILGIGIAVAGLASAASLLRDPGWMLVAQARIVAAVGSGAAALVTVVTGVALMVTSWQLLVVPLVAAGVTAIVLTRVAIRPLARQAGSAMAERDLVIAVAEAERNRLAAALHDGPLGDITLLVQRLDLAGDEDNAAIARSIAGELRAIGNDLYLPVLEDLGVGPALEWLVERLLRRAGAEVRLELANGVRPPADVELAVYRIAQEALSNAVRHGRPPVLVRYAARAGSVSLSVDDTGPGLDREAVGRAQREGRLGMVLMSQRADAIGAELVLATPAGGGTHVGLTWSASMP